jgi:hypothetical protein
VRRTPRGHGEGGLEAIADAPFGVSTVSFKVFGLVRVSIWRRCTGSFDRTGNVFSCTSNISAGRAGEVAVT